MLETGVIDARDAICCQYTLEQWARCTCYSAEYTVILWHLPAPPGRMSEAEKRYAPHRICASSGYRSTSQRHPARHSPNIAMVDRHCSLACPGIHLMRCGNLLRSPHCSAPRTAAPPRDAPFSISIGNRCQKILRPSCCNAKNGGIRREKP